MSIFTKKHYEFIAKILSSWEACDSEVAQWALVFEEENDNFDREKFEKAAFAYAEED